MRKVSAMEAETPSQRMSLFLHLLNNTGWTVPDVLRRLSMGVNVTKVTVELVLGL